MENNIILANQEDFEKIVMRLSHEILESNSYYSDFVLIVIKTRGEFLCSRIKKNIEEANSMYENMLDRTTESLEKIIENAETSSNIQ